MYNKTEFEKVRKVLNIDIDDLLTLLGTSRCSFSHIISDRRPDGLRYKFKRTISDLYKVDLLNCEEEDMVAMAERSPKLQINELFGKFALAKLDLLKKMRVEGGIDSLEKASELRSAFRVYTQTKAELMFFLFEFLDDSRFSKECARVDAKIYSILASCSSQIGKGNSESVPQESIDKELSEVCTGNEDLLNLWDDSILDFDSYSFSDSYLEVVSRLEV